MQIDYLRYFIDVATLGSMSAAAKKNHMTPQGISRSISTLESEYGCALFQRDSNKVMLTQVGEEVLGYAHQMVNAEQSMRLSIAELQSGKLKRKETTFTFYGSTMFFDTPLLHPASGLASAHYESVKLLQRNTSDVAKLLVEAARSTRADRMAAGGLGLSDLFSEKSSRIVETLMSADYEYHPFMRTSDYVLAPEYSPLAHAQKLSTDDLRSYRMAISSDEDMEAALQERFGSKRIYVAASDGAYRMRLARLGEAVALIPGFALAFSLPEGTVAVPMAEPYTIEIGFAAHPGVFEDGLLADIVERLTEFYRAHEDLGTYELLDDSVSDSLFA